MDERHGTQPLDLQVESSAWLGGGLRVDHSDVDYLCSGTLLQRTKVCGKAGCRCARDPNARHGPYYEWGHMQGGKLVHRTLSPEQAVILQLAIDNYRNVKRLLRDWEVETERLIENNGLN